MAHFDVIIVGGGVVGLATALNLLEKRPNLSLAILEKESSVAQHQTGHNSGVIHSGLYYQPGSLKAILCVDGYRRLLAFCQQNNIAHEVCGKVVVAATPDQSTQLDELERRGLANGLNGIQRLGPEGIREHEPHCAGVAGLFIPQTGIVDYTEVCKTLQSLVTSLGGQVIFNHRVTGIVDESSKVTVLSDADIHTATFVITCGGLHSDQLAQHTINDLDLRILPFRGEYFVLRKSAESLVNNLIYPVPNPSFPFLGVHFTRMIDGAIECGPNAVLAFAREGYSKTAVRPRELIETLTWPGFRRVATKYWRTGLGEYRRSFSKQAFVRALQTLVPSITTDDLLPAPAGVRAQACDREGNLLDDFALRESGRVLHVCNAPSPAATASLAIGDYIATRVISRFFK
jgi:(S)-2-hydroxyglutarate dehydrogenase